MASGSIQSRLRDAIERHGQGSIRHFANEMRSKNEKRSKKVRGVTRSMIHRYLRPDGPTPPPDFLEAAAEVLGVTVEWLRDGPPSNELAIWEWWDVEVREGLNNGLPGLAEVGFAGHPLARAVAFLTLWNPDTTPDHPMPFSLRQLARRVARSVAGPAEAFGVDFVEMAEESPRAAEMYIDAVVMALNALAMYKGPFGYNDPAGSENN